MADQYIGEIRLFAISYTPRFWAACEGQVLKIADHSALFSLIGTLYGGDGRVSFGLPNLIGRAPVHFGQVPKMPYLPMGYPGGSAETRLILENMPVHAHTATAHTVITPETPGSAKLKGAGDPADKDYVEGNYLASTSGTNLYRDSSRNFKEMASDAIELTDPTFEAQTTVSVGSVGGNVPINNMQPFLAMRYCIALEGEYPSRS